MVLSLALRFLAIPCLYVLFNSAQFAYFLAAGGRLVGDGCACAGVFNPSNVSVVSVANANVFVLFFMIDSL